MFVWTKRLSRENTSFVMTKVCLSVVIKMILVTAPTSDKGVGPGGRAKLKEQVVVTYREKCVMEFLQLSCGKCCEKKDGFSDLGCMVSYRGTSRSLFQTWESKARET